MTDETTEAPPENEDQLETETPADDRRSTLDITKAPITYNTLVSLSQTPTVPDRYAERPFDMYAAMLVGRELGVDIMTSINELYLVDGKVSMSAKLMGSLVMREGHILKTKLSATGAEVEGYRRMPNGQLVSMGSVTFTEEDAKQAKLWGTGAWKTFPQVMLGWRALSIAARFFFPECLTAVKYIADEVGIDEGEMPPLPNAVVVAELMVDEGEPLDAEEIAEVFEAEIVEGSEEDDDNQGDEAQAKAALSDMGINVSGYED